MTRKMRPLKERFLDKVSVSDGCWAWLGGARGNGYGGFHLLVDGKRKSVAAHRVSYALFCGELSPNLVVMHSCDNRMCVNPSHLSQGTMSMNMQDAAAKGRIRLIGKGRLTHCCRGHEFTEENTARNRAGHRKCRECARIANRQWKRAAAIRSREANHDQ